MQKTFAEMIEAAGGKVTERPGERRAQSDDRRRQRESRDRRHPHEREGGGWRDRSASASSGIARMCSSPMAASSSSNPYKNPTLTILALAWRQAEHLLAEMKRGSLPAPA